MHEEKTRKKERKKNIRPYWTSQEKDIQSIYKQKEKSQLNHRSSIFNHCTQDFNKWIVKRKKKVTKINESQNQTGTRTHKKTNIFLHKNGPMKLTNEPKSWKYFFFLLFWWLHPLKWLCTREEKKRPFNFQLLSLDFSEFPEADLYLYFFSCCYCV